MVLSRRWPERIESLLEKDYSVWPNTHDQPMSAAAMRRTLRKADGFCPTVTDRLDSRVLRVPSPRTRILANFGVGFEHIDLDGGAARGYCGHEHARCLDRLHGDLAMALILATARGIVRGDRMLRAGDWPGWRPVHVPGVRVSGKTLGLVGFGRIGKAVAQRAGAGFGMRVRIFTPRPPDEQEARELGVEICSSLDELLESSDFVSLHCPVTPETAGMMSTAQFARMRAGAILINTARGALVDEYALVEALRAGQLGGAGLERVCA